MGTSLALKKTQLLEGDTFTVAVADLLRANFRNSDTLSRWGDRESLVLMLECQEPPSREVAEHLLVEVDRWNEKRLGREMVLT